jgi:hypothetical protein
MIKLKDILSEVYKHPLYKSDKVHFFVKKPFSLYVASGDKEPTGQWSTAGPGGNKMIYRDKATMVTAEKGMQISNLPGGVFLIDRKKKQAVRIITKKGGTGKPSNLEQIPPNGHIHFHDYSSWKRWL